MAEHPKWTLKEISRKCGRYWQAVLWFGLPFTILYRGIDYTIFRITTANAGLSYPWRGTAVKDVALLFLVSTIWWGLMRQIAASERNNTRG
jgi:hypothetical protein